MSDVDPGTVVRGDSAASAPPTASAARRDPELEAALARLARARTLLVASDFDGTLSEIAPDPAGARAAPGAAAALARLARLPQTHAAVVSGRGRSELGRLIGAPAYVHLAGSHGAEMEFAPSHASDPGFADRHARLRREIEAIAAAHEGCRAEIKPISVALHYRGATAPVGEAALKAALAGPARHPGVHVLHGKMVVELAAAEVGKGRALATLRRRLGAEAVVFLGDDLTDEDAFAVLIGPDVGVKVGPGDSRAGLRVAGVSDVVEILTDLAERRAAWCEALAAAAEPIERHALLSDQRTLALVDERGRLAWACFPRVDSPAVFASILGDERLGAFTVRPAGAPPGARAAVRYTGDSFLLESDWGDIRVLDYFDCSAGRAFQRAGRSELIRAVEAAPGRPGGAVEIVFAPRLEFARHATRLRIHPEGVVVEWSKDPFVLRAPGVAWTLRDDGPHQVAVGRAEVAPERPILLELRYGLGHLRPAQQEEGPRRVQSERFWSQWAATLRLPSTAREAVKRSALVLKALAQGPTGAIVAAGTCSLPEDPGGVRNWDYRFCWPRDACLAAAALVRLGTHGQAMKLLDWLLAVVDTLDSPERLRPIYTVSARGLPAEEELAHVPGYRLSTPVRTGNAADHQVQMDVFGPIVDLVWLLASTGAPISGEHWRLVETMVTAVERRWTEPDNGIWEVRDTRQHFVHSKTMCWVTADRAVRLAETYLGEPRPAWAALRDAIAADVLAHGFDTSRNAFTIAYGNPNLDAAALHVGLSGLLPPDDPRFIGTVEAVERELRSDNGRGPVVYRYLFDDGIPGGEGGFHICTSWLIEAYSLIGRKQDAIRLFDQMAALAGPTGLLSEEHCPRTGLALGNHPQAYSHLGLINAALCIDQRCRAVVGGPV